MPGWPRWPPAWSVLRCRGSEDVVPAARTVLVRLDRAPAETDAAALRRLARTPPPPAPDLPPVELPVVFDGPDLAEVAELTGRPVDGAGGADSSPSSTRWPSAASPPASAT